MKVIFIAHDGKKTEVEAQEGESVMHVAVQNDVDGIIGECGGSMMCATCHCYVDDDWVEKAGKQRDGEGDMLECAASEVTPASRLSCQIKMTCELDGLVIHLPEAQI